MSESVKPPRPSSGASGSLARPARPAVDSPLRGPAPSAQAPSALQKAWLRRGLDQPGGKLPLFDPNGKQIDPRTIRRCIEAGWAEPWFANPLKPDWLVCKLTGSGRAAALRAARPKRAKRAAPRAVALGAGPDIPRLGR